MFAALIDIPANVGYTLVFVLIAVETMGIPVPAETALIGAALLAHRGQMDIGTLTVLAATAAILGDNVGFAIGRHFGRRIFVAPGPLPSPPPEGARARRAVLRSATARRPCSSAAGSRACGSRPRGWRG